MTATIPAQRAPQERVTRRPTGLPSWPILLIAGAEKAGKSWSCAEASGSDLIGRTLWVGIGEDDPDEYANVPGADFEIVPHDGSLRDILAAVEWACAQEPVDGKPVLVVLDSATRLWDLICDMAQDQATARLRKKEPNSTAEADIHMDLWNQAKDRWGHVLDALRSHRGPVLVTARLEEVTVMVNGKPSRSGERTLKVKAEKNLPYDVGGIVQLPERGKALLTGVRTTRLSVPKPLPLPSFTVDGLWRKLGLHELQAGDRAHSPVLRNDPVTAQRVVLLREIKTLVGDDHEHLKAIAGEWAKSHDGQAISETTDIGGLELLRDDLIAARDPGLGEVQEELAAFGRSVGTAE